MSNLYVLTYNNYYNRTIRKEDTLNGYLNDRSYYTIQGANFNPNDGIDAQHVFNSTHKATAYDGSGDYFLVADGDEIISRWFIVESRRNTAGQWTLFLRRDVVADYLDNIRSATCFIEKGTVGYNDSAIFNSEKMTFNQIKSGETKLFDRSGCPWVVGYYDRAQAGEISGTVTQALSDRRIIPLDVSDITDWDMYKYTEGAYGPIERINYVAYGRPLYATRALGRYVTDYQTGITQLRVYTELRSTGMFFPTSFPTVEQVQEQFVAYGLNNLYSTAMDYYSEEVSDIDELRSWGDKFVSVGDKIYQVIVSYMTTERELQVPSGSLFEALSAIYYPLCAGSYAPNSETFTAEVTQKAWKLDIIERKDMQLTYSIGTSPAPTSDAPYNIFAIPLGVVHVVTSADGSLYTDPYVAIDAAMSMALEHQTRIYDIQILPYCPVPTLLTGDAEISTSDSRQYSFVSSEQLGNQTVIFNVPSATFGTTIDLDVPITITEPKVQAECDMYRIASPNWNSVFEFNAAKNGGVSFFNVQCTYKPYTPFVRIAPNFARLYGNDYGDARGLILNGDFSLPTLTDQWKLYEINNKNYQQSFDRRIENMEIKQGAQRVQDIAGSIAGAVGGAASGAVLTGGAAGAVAGGIASAVGGIIDFGINEMLRNEAIDYTKDQFGYTLGNIQALPRTITRVGAYNAVNKLVPVLEYYTCTPEEKQALRDKIRYNGMTIMRIGLFGDYIRSNVTYIKAQLIRIEVGEDTHVVNTIANELNKGVFI